MGRTLDPSSLPVETDARFALLVAASVLVSMNAGTLLALVILPEGALTLPDGAAAVDADAPPDEYFAAARDGYLSAAAASLVWFVPPFGMAGLVLLVGIIRYRRHPQIIAAPLFPPTKPHEREGEEVVRVLAQEAGIDPPRVLVRRRTGKVQDAQAFGHVKDPVLRVDAGLLVARRKRPLLFEGVMRHELAHFANGDVRRTYLAEGLWWATRYVALVPFAASVLLFMARRYAWPLVQGEPFEASRLLTVALPEFALLMVSLALLVSIAVASYASLLRERERHADWRAAAIAREAVAEAMRARAQAEPRRPWWDRFRAKHPPAATRARDLFDEAALFHASRDVPVLVGAALGLLMVGMYDVVTRVLFVALGGLLGATAALASSALASGNDLLFIVSYAAALATPFVVAALIAAPAIFAGWLAFRTVGVAQLRSAVADALGTGVRRRPALDAFATAGLVALGMELGFAAELFSFHSPVRMVMDGTWSPWPFLAWFATAVSAFALLLAGARFLGRRLVARGTGAVPPRRTLAWASRGFTFAAAGVFAALAMGRLVVANVAGTEGAPAVLAGAVAAAGAALAVWALTMLGIAFATRRAPACTSCGVPLPRSLTAACPGCGVPLAAWLAEPQVESPAVPVEPG